MKSSNSSLLFSILVACLIAGCSETPLEVTSNAGAAEFVNTKCPIMGGAIDASKVDPSLIKDWNGKKVAFCCPPCLEDWDELSDAEKAEKIANPPKGHSETSHDHSDHGDHPQPGEENPDHTEQEAAPHAAEPNTTKP